MGCQSYWGTLYDSFHFPADDEREEEVAKQHQDQPQLRMVLHNPGIGDLQYRLHAKPMLRGPWDTFRRGLGDDGMCTQREWMNVDQPNCSHYIQKDTGTQSSAVLMMSVLCGCLKKKYYPVMQNGCWVLVGDLRSLKRMLSLNYLCQTF